jgi:hypothetical protein
MFLGLLGKIRLLEADPKNLDFWKQKLTIEKGFSQKFPVFFKNLFFRSGFRNSTSSHSPKFCSKFHSVNFSVKLTIENFHNVNFSVKLTIEN